MNTELFGVVAILFLTFILAWPLGKYISKVFKGEKVWSDFLSPLENWVLRICSIDPNESMDWKRNMKAMLRLNLIFFLWSILILMIQKYIPIWNPANIGNMEATLAYNTATSFTSNTNLQHYSGETGLSYFSQLLVICFLQFVSAGTGIATLALLFKGLVQKQAADLGNFYHLFLKSCTRILLPLSIVVAIIFLLNGMPTTFAGLQEVQTLEGDTVQVATGPVAPVIAIKQLGTNGGGFFGPNCAHPFENANYLTNISANISILLIPVALVFAFGFYLNRKKLAWIFFGVMTIVFLTFVSSAATFESSGNPEIAKLGISQPPGSMEGKEVRFGAAASALWGVSTTSTSNGSVNSMHDSQTPFSGGIFLLDMMINAVYGGVGVGFINFFMFVVIAVFIGGLMIGRTPEFLGKKIEAREVKIASLVILLHPFLILVGTAIAAFTAAIEPAIGWLNNPSYHGFSEMLYEFTSASANNGSGFEGLADNTPFWNIACGTVMLLGRYLPIIGPIALAGSLAAKKSVPFSSGSLKVDSLAFGVVLLGVLVVIAALSFFPALTLGPIAEFFSM
ncbi:MAG: potassium-transporting ATPase subunit A [Calditrichaceae bacterium]|nr:potassium-transporting ATPase subunit KdpA [Calditrichia bacterium]NUQ41107.1 potassium-transporting ATPase subunit A [Calditrichaceae bacterium]